MTVAELERLRTIENVVRLGRVQAIRTDTIELEQGTIPTDRGQLHVDCSTAGLGKAPPRPIFEPGRITLQCISTGFPTFNAAVIGYLEASRGSDEVAYPPPLADKSLPRRGERLDPEHTRPAGVAQTLNEQADMAAWLKSSRLNIARGMFTKASEPRMAEAIARLLTYTEPAVANLEKLDSCQPRLTS